MPMPRLTLSRTLLSSALLAVALYAIAGVWGVPALIRHALHQYLEVKHQRHYQLGEVRFNPFTLRLDIDRLAVPDADGQPLLAFGHLAADLRLGSLLKGGADVESVTIDAPRVRLIQRRDGRINVMDLVPPSDPSSPMPKAWIHVLAITRGEAEYADQARATPFQVSVTAFNLELHDFYTRSSNNAYKLNARSKLDATFAWAGTFGLDPVVSRGELHIGNFRAEAIADAGPNLLPFNVAQGTLDLNGRYDYAPHDDGLGLRLDISDLTCHDLALRAPQQADSWLEVAQLQVTNTTVDFTAATATVGHLRVDGAKVRAWRERDGSINLSRLYVPLRPDPAAPAAPAAKPWTVNVPDIGLTAADVTFRDLGPRTPATFHFAPLDLTVTGYSTARDAPLAVELRATVNESGTIEAKGELAASPFAGRLALQIDRLALKSLQPYIDGRASLRLHSGMLNFRGTTTLVAGGGVTLDGDGSVDELRTTDNALEEDFVKWRSLRFGGLHARSMPVSLQVREVLAREPYARVIVGSNGRTNLSIVLHPGQTDVDASDAAPAPATPASPAPAPAPTPIDIGIGVVRVEAGSMNFADFSVQPQFAAGIHELAGTITGVSSKGDSRATVALAGKVDRFAPVTIAGKLNFLSAKTYADVRMSFKNLELTGLSPYSGKFAGYWIDKGKMSADLDYRIDDRRINANHHIVVNQLQLGKHVDSPDATSLPIRLGIALLKDSDGVIDIELPVTGSLDDPDFRVGKIIWKVFINLLTKAVTSPFRLLGSLFGGGDELEFMEFSAGDARLDDATRARAASLVKALAARPGLSIDVPMAYSTELDGPALAAAKWQAELETRAARRLGADAGEAGQLARLQATPAAYRSLLEEAYADAFGHKATMPAAQPGTTADQAKAAATAWLESALRSHAAIGPRELEALASARASAVQAALLDGTGIDPSRVFVVKAPPQAATGDRLRLQLVLH